MKRWCRLHALARCCTFRVGKRARSRFAVDRYPLVGTRRFSDDTSSFGSFDWMGVSPSRENRREILRRQLISHGLEIVRPIGRGTFGRVVLARDTTLKQYYAVKIQQISENEMNRAQAEEALGQLQELKVLRDRLPDGIVRDYVDKTIEDIDEHVSQANPTGGNMRPFEGKLVRRAIAESSIMRSLDHPFIVKLHSTFEELDRLFMVLTFVPGGTLGRFVQQCGGKLSLEQTRFCVAEIALGLAYLRSQHISHRDVKPSNILLDEEGHIQLIDFGLATTQDEVQVFCGTCEYVAPEMLLSRTWSAEPIDWWALGVLTFELLTGRVPFPGRTTQEVFTAIMMDQLAFPDDFPEEARAFVSDLLHRDPQRRVQPPKIFGHPFFDGVDFKAVSNKEVTSPLRLYGHTETSRTLLLPQ